MFSALSKTWFEGLFADSGGDGVSLTPPIFWELDYYPRDNCLTVPALVPKHSETYTPLSETLLN